MPKSNQLSPRSLSLELEMAIRGYQRICTLQSAATPARCREACPSSQCLARRARTMRPTWGNTRTHVSNDITRPSPSRRRGLSCSRKVVVFFLETTRRKICNARASRTISRQIPFSPAKMANEKCIIATRATGNETERSSLFSTELSPFISIYRLFSSAESLFRSFSLFLPLFTFLAPRAPLPYKLISRLAGASAAGAEQLNSLFPFTYPFVSTFTFIFE